MALLEGMGQMAARLSQRGRKGLMTLIVGTLFLLNLNGALAAGSASIGGCVWYDDNGNTVWDGGENGMAGVTVELYNVLEPGNTYTRTTTEDGSYQFADLPAGDYIVQVPETVKLGLAEYALTTDNHLPISLAGEDCSDANFGYEALASTGGPAEPTAVTLSSFAAKSGTNSAVSPLWLGLAGLTLAAGNLFWRKRLTG
jgi:hypothetical protein